MTNSIPTRAGWLLDEYDAERFWSHVNYHGGVEHTADRLSTATGGCWEWQGDKGVDGYGRFRLFGRYAQAHRLSYRDFGNDLPDGMLIDHLCRNKRCVNPHHLEAVTHAENVRRGLRGNITHCPHGHQYTLENTTYVTRKGKHIRYCLTCLRASRNATYLRRKAAGKV